MLTNLLPQFLLVFGLSFLAVNLRAGLELARWIARRSSTLLVWPAPKPPFYGLNLAIGVMLGCLLLFKIFIQPNSLSAIFGELMMFVYFGYAVPLSTRIKRGLYEDGIWTDNGFIAYRQVGGLSWRETDGATLVVIAKTAATARRLNVPGPVLGEVRRLLREKIAARVIEFEGGPGLHLGERDVRDNV